MVAWKCQVETDIIFSSEQPGDDDRPCYKSSFASIVLKGNIENCGYMLVQSGKAPVTWEAFCNDTRREFVHKHSFDRSMEKLGVLDLKKLVTTFINELLSTFTSIYRVSNDEKLETFSKDRILSYCLK